MNPIMINPQKIWTSKQLPTLPGVAMRLVSIANDPDPAIPDVIRAIQNDPAIAAKVLKAANSSLFGLRSSVTTINRAVALLGTTGVTSLALSFALEEAAMNSGPLAAHYRAYWLQSVVQAVTSEVLGSRVSKGLRGEYFVAGLLIDIGRLALLKTVPTEYMEVLTRVEEQHEPLQQVERKVLGLDHVEIGARLMETWKLPARLNQACVTHHAPAAQILTDAPEEVLEVAKVMGVASAVGDYFCLQNKALARIQLAEIASALYGYSQPEIEELLGKVKTQIDECSDLFSLKPDEICSPSELIAAASEQLAELAMREYLARSAATARQMTIELEKQELEAHTRELQARVLRDALTGLYNREFFDAALEHEINRCSRQSKPVGVIFADLDRFKQLNDTYGHPFGDKVLAQVGTLLTMQLRDSDIVARRGGEEFVILVVEPTPDHIELVAERVRKRVEAHEFMFEGKRVPVTISIGAAVTFPNVKITDWSARLISAADEAMYNSKRKGRNRVTVCELPNTDEAESADEVNATLAGSAR